MTPPANDASAPDDELEVAEAIAGDENSDGEDQDEESYDEELDDPDADFGPPFDAKSFGGQFVWASKAGFEAKILRVRAGQKVVVSTKGRRDMVAMLTGGRGLLETIDGDEIERTELEPASPVDIIHGPEYRLVAMTDVELFTIHSPARPD